MGSAQPYSSGPAPDAAKYERARLPIGRATMPPVPHLEEHRDASLANQMAAAQRVMELFVTRFDPRELPQSYPPENERKERAFAELSRCVDETSSQFSPGVDRNIVLDHVANEAVALGPLEYYLDDDSITDIYVNSADCVLYEKGGRLCVAPHTFTSPDFLYLAAQRLLAMQGYTAEDAPPQTEVRFSDGTLIQVILPPVAVGGPVLTVRKPRRNFPSLSDLVEQQVLSNEMAEFLHQSIEARRTILVAGPTASGRTTLVNALLRLIPDGARIVSVENTAMFQLTQRSAIALETQPESAFSKAVTSEALVEHATRLRPDRLVVDSLMDGAALGFLKATAGGASGSMGVITGLSAQDAIRRLEQLALLGQNSSAGGALYEQIARGVDLVIVLHRFGNGTRRVVEISEVCGATSRHVDIETIFTFDLTEMGNFGEGGGRFAPSGYIPRFYRELESGGVNLDKNIFND